MMDCEFKINECDKHFYVKDTKNRIPVYVFKLTTYLLLVTTIKWLKLLNICWIQDLTWEIWVKPMWKLEWKFQEYQMNSF